MTADLSQSTRYRIVTALADIDEALHDQVARSFDLFGPAAQDQARPIIEAAMAKVRAVIQTEIDELTSAPRVLGLPLMLDPTLGKVGGPDTTEWVGGGGQ